MKEGKKCQQMAENLVQTVKQPDARMVLKGDTFAECTSLSIWEHWRDTNELEASWFLLEVHAAMCAQSCLTLVTPWALGSSVHEIYREEWWNVLLFPSPWDLANKGIKPTYSVCLLHWQQTWTTWDAHIEGTM